MQVRLTRIESNRRNLRTNEVVGRTDGEQLPKVGKRFCMIGPSLSEGPSIRYIETTLVEEVIQQDENTYEFRTQNSTYKLEIFEEQ